MLRVPYCGGRWNNGAKAGVFAVNLNSLRSNVNANIGFRSALPQSQMLRTYWVRSQYRGVKDSISTLFTAKNKGLAKACPFGRGMPRVAIVEIRNAPERKMEGIVCP